jgi:hypothetical protein
MDMTTTNEITSTNHYACVGSDGISLVVWGLGATPEAARADAREQETDGEDVDAMTIREVTADQAEAIRRGASLDALRALDLVTVETMPDHLRESHRAARNWGRYPANGAERTQVTREEAEEIVTDDADGYAHIIESSDAPSA